MVLSHKYITKVALAFAYITYIIAAFSGTSYAGQLKFDGVPVDITTSDEEDLVVAPGSGGNVQIGIGSGANTYATGQNDLHITGILESSGAAYLDSNVTLGSASTNTISALGRLSSNLLPATSGSYNLGSSTLVFSNLYTNIISGFAYFDLANGRLGIGVSAPQARLDIRASGSSTGFALRISDTTPTDRVVVLDNGNVGIGTTAPVYKLQVIGTLDATTITQAGSAIGGTFKTGEK